MWRRLGWRAACACGSIRYALKAKPLIVHACHCTDCQRLTGGPFVINAWIEKAKVELLSSNPASFKFDTGGRDNSVHFCPQCGTYVWTEYMPGFCFVRACTLDEQNALIPDVHIFARSKQPWLDLPGDIPVHEVYYDRDKVWPDDSLARFAAVTASMK
ncbi:MAG: aldehyde-activating protein [Rhodospirillaceae bacterium]|nr:aldehyde-activating protein [Rhodospirillaceae bacterium]MEE1554472.1 GFA family protein [Alphaproteobacteria bacterium]